MANVIYETSFENPSSNFYMIRRQGECSATKKKCQTTTKPPLQFPEFIPTNGTICIQTFYSQPRIPFSDGTFKKTHLAKYVDWDFHKKKGSGAQSS